MTDTWKMPAGKGTDAVNNRPFVMKNLVWDIRKCDDEVYIDAVPDTHEDTQFRFDFYSRLSKDDAIKVAVAIINAALGEEE